MTPKAQQLIEALGYQTVSDIDEFMMWAVMQAAEDPTDPDRELALEIIKEAYTKTPSVCH
jgi:hypothetical protein